MWSRPCRKCVRLRMMNRYEQVGLVTELACKSSYRLLPIARLSIWVFPAIAHGQVKFAFDESGSPIGYWTWAWLASDASKRLIKDPGATLHESEWNEGDDLWIMDFSIQRGYLRDVIRYMREVQFSDVPQAYSLRRFKDGTLKKMSRWRPTFSLTYNAMDAALFYRLPESAFADSKTEWRKSNQLA
jgi:cytolysin-activating lysine-acyltransferase